MSSYSMAPQAASSYIMPPQVMPIPQPNGSGTINIYNIKPSNSGSLSLADAAVSSHNSYPAPLRSIYRSSRSRSRSPLRSTPNRFRDQHNSYRDERGKEPLTKNIREQSPGITSSTNTRCSPLTGRRIAGLPDHLTSEKSTETVMIDSSVVGLIIGRQGENMRRIEADTQTRIQFEKVPENTGAMRRCTITGSKSARDYAVAEVKRIIAESEKAGKIGSGRAPPPPGRDLSGGPGMNGLHPPPSHAGNETVIMVPSKTVGLVIGKGGETIKDLQDRSHCHVNVMPGEQTVNGLRPVHLLGNPQQASVAKDLIMEIVYTEAKKTSSHGGTPRDNVNVTNLSGRGSNEKISDSVVVPSEAIGMIIGKGGETVREMQMNTGCKINVSQPSGRDLEREIELIGSRYSVDQAKAAIMEKVHAVQERIDRTSSHAHYDNSPITQTQIQSPAKQIEQQPYPFEVGEPPGGHEAYAAYGGYQNYVALWYASTQGKQAQQDSFPQSSGPPGTSYS
ncbi:MAG: hypothetical protein Q9217_003496 [Psora testacea]